MIPISKEEAFAVRKAVPGAAIRRTVHHYYIEESRPVMAFLKRFNANKRRGVSV